MKRSKNSGFSLVELVVVVLIMGVIAVALAPQVIKWVGEAKGSADFQAKDELLSVAQVALAEYEGQAQAPALEDEDYIVTASGVVAADGTDNNAGMIALLEANLGDEFPTVQDEQGKVFRIRMKSVGRKIQIGTTPGTY